MNDRSLSIVGFCLLPAVLKLRQYYLLLCAEIDCNSTIHSIESQCSDLRQYVETIIPKRNIWLGSYYLDMEGVLATSLMFTVRNFFRVLTCRVTYHRIKLKLKDGGTVGMDIAHLHNSQPPSISSYPSSKPVILISHGMLGDSNSEYLIFLVERLVVMGYLCVVMVSRGCGGLELTTTKSFCWFDCGDYNEALEFMRSPDYFPSNPIVAIGFSLGAGLLLKFLGQEPASMSKKIDLAIAVSPPWNISARTRYFDVWSSLLVVPLKAFILKHYHMLKRHDISLWQILSTRNLTEWDTLFVKAYGMKDITEYYSQGSAVHTCDRIHTRTIAISAVDDPICDYKGKPEPHMIGPGLAVVTAKFGGHLGFPGPVLGRSWVDDLIIRAVTDLDGTAGGV